MKLPKNLDHIYLRYDSIEKVRKVAELLKNSGYTIKDHLDKAKEGDHIPALWINTQKQNLSTSTGTCMACYSSAYGLKVMYAKDFIKYFYELMIKKDLFFYQEYLLLLTITERRNKYKKNKK